MNRRSRQWVMMGLLVVVSVFFGMELASRGIDRVHGPMSTAPPAAANGSATGSHPPAMSADASRNDVAADGPATNDSDSRPLVLKDSLINRVGNKTGELLQIIAYHSIRKVVSIFNIWMD